MAEDRPRVKVTIAGPVGTGKVGLYNLIMKAIQDVGVEVAHIDPAEFEMEQRLSSSLSDPKGLEVFQQINPVVFLEQNTVRADTFAGLVSGTSDPKVDKITLAMLLRNGIETQDLRFSDVAERLGIPRHAVGRLFNGFHEAFTLEQLIEFDQKLNHSTSEELTL